MPVLRLFAAAREAAGTGRDDVPGDTVGDVLATATARYGSSFAHVLETCRIWVNGDAAGPDRPVGPGDEVAVLPPVSGGSDAGLPAEIEDVRARRRRLQELDDALSYVRRVAQARADLTRAEQARRRATATGAVDLDEVLADRLLGGGDRPPRPADDFSEHPRAVELDELCARLGFARLDELTDQELATLAGGLDELERTTSGERHRVHTELDQLTDALVEGYRDRYEGTLDRDEDADAAGDAGRRDEAAGP